MDKDYPRYHKALDLQSFPAMAADAGTSKMTGMEKVTYIAAFTRATEASDQTERQFALHSRQPLPVRVSVSC